MMRVAKRKTKVQMMVQSEPTTAGTFEEYAIRITPTLVYIRPLRARAGGRTEVGLNWGQLYIRALVAKVDAERASKRKRKVKRGKK